MWVDKAGLHPEFGKIVCVSIGRFLKDGSKEIQSFGGMDEADILQKTAKIFNNADIAGFELSGYNIEKFDVPFLWKRMLVNGVKPPGLINIWNKKPWELRLFDVAKLWNGGVWSAMTPLETVGTLFNVGSSKDDLNGSMVHDVFWNYGDHERIKKYCEQDVAATMDISLNIIDLLKP